jgi:uncharacterized iron-regulated membrane protein
MPTFALSDFWVDFYAISGFWLGLVALVVGVLGFGYTIYQVRKTRSAAEAAQEAAERAIKESRHAVRAMIAGGTLRWVSELRDAVRSEAWDLAARRANDLADLIAAMPIAEAPLEELRRELRKWAETFHKRASNRIKQFQSAKWAEFFLHLEAAIDRLRVPLVFGEG